jgi:hypothetical protein
MERHKLIEIIAREIYEATMGDAAIVPWPGSNADNYRRIASRVIDRLERENIFP